MSDRARPSVPGPGLPVGPGERPRTSAGLPWPRITVVTPCYQAGRYLEATIRSVLGQGYPDLEYLILDGGSTDGSVDVIERYAPQLAYWRSGPDDGGHAAVNEGFARASGDVLAWLNADDVYLPGALHLAGDLFAARPEVAWLTTLTRGAMNREGECHVSTMPGVSNESLLGGHHLPAAGGRRSYYGFVQQESTFFRRPLWDAAGGLRPEIGLAADFALWLDFARLAPIHAVDRLLGAFRTHDRNLSGDRAGYLASAHAALAAARRAAGWGERPVARLRAVLPWPLRRPLRGLVGYRTALLRRDERTTDRRWALEHVPFL